MAILFAIVAVVMTFPWNKPLTPRPLVKIEVSEPTREEILVDITKSIKLDLCESPATRHVLESVRRVWQHICERDRAADAPLWYCPFNSSSSDDSMGTVPDLYSFFEKQCQDAGLHQLIATDLLNLRVIMIAELDKMKAKLQEKEPNEAYSQ